jgi:hypothetical protein
MNETAYRNQLQIDLSAAGFRVFRNNVGIFFTHNGTPTRCGLCKGSADLIGIAPGGRLLSIETKSKAGRTRPEQVAWAEMINKMGGIAIFARPGDDVVGTIKSRLTEKDLSR